MAGNRCIYPGMRMFFSLVLLFSFSAHAQSPAPASPRITTPLIGANLLGIYRRGTGVSDNRADVPHNGFSLQEAEIGFSADVDAYLRANIIMAVEQEDGATEYAVEPEEAYLETRELPYVAIKAGKFKMALGKHNLLHTHAFPFIDAPLIHESLLGHEGLADAGVSAAAILPVSWYSEIILQAFDAGNEDLFSSPRSGSQAGLLAIRNLWDLTDDMTAEFGLSGAMGQNQYDRAASVFAVDFTLKWRDSELGKYRTVVWSTEYLQGRRPGLVDDSGDPIENLGGIVTWIQYQFARRWWVQGRYEYFGLPHSDAIPVVDKQTALVGFYPSEFSGIRLQYDLIDNRAADERDQTISLQYNISIGAHPAHGY